MKEEYMHHRHPILREQDGSLGSLLESCGRCYAHRAGGRRGQGNVLTLIGQNPGITQKELTERLGIQPASLSELLMKLERKGLVVREKDENDRRVTKVDLTEEGKNRLSQPEEETADPFQVLTIQEQDTLKELLGKLLSDWQSRYPAHRRGSGGREHHPEHGEGHHHGGHLRESESGETE